MDVALVSNDCSNVDVSPTKIERRMLHTKNNKGTGRDNVPNEILKAGGGAAAVQISRLGERIVKEEKWPCEWQGGRKLCKKGSPLECNNYIGIFVSAAHAQCCVGVRYGSCHGSL